MNMYTKQYSLNLVPSAEISDWGQFNSLFWRIKHGSLQFCPRFYCTTEMKTKSMIQAQAQKMMINCVDSREECRVLSAWEDYRVLVLLLLGFCLGSQLSSRRQHSCLGSANYHVRDLNLDHIIFLFSQSQPVCFKRQNKNRKSKRSDDSDLTAKLKKKIVLVVS